MDCGFYAATFVRRSWRYRRLEAAESRRAPRCALVLKEPQPTGKFGARLAGLEGGCAGRSLQFGILWLFCRMSGIFEYFAVVLTFVKKNKCLFYYLLFSIYTHSFGFGK